MSAPSFVHLRLHSEYSVSDGIVRLDDAVAAAVADGMPALALTDLANVFGMVKFYQAARRRGVKPIIGCDVWLENDTDRDKPYRLLLLCQSRAGYLQSVRAADARLSHNQYRGRAELKRDWFAAPASEGLIALSGAHRGDVGQALLAGNDKHARELAKQWAELFPQRYYLELQRLPQGAAVQLENCVQQSLRLASKMKLPVVATHPVQFLQPDDFKAHEARVCIAEGYMLSDQRRPKHFSADQYFKIAGRDGRTVRRYSAGACQQRGDRQALQSRARTGQDEAAEISDAEPGKSRRLSARARADGARAAACSSFIPMRRSARKNCRSISSGSNSRSRPSSRWGFPVIF